MARMRDEIKEELNIVNLNQKRSVAGIPPVHHVWCKICRQVNVHFWWNCPNIKCTICNAAHSTSQCPYKCACQWCGSTDHISAACNNAAGLAQKAMCKRRCFRCGRFGHIAMHCFSNKVINARKRWKYRFRRRRRRRRR